MKMGVKDAKDNQPQKHAADARRIFHDRRSILRARKRTESDRLPGGAFARETCTIDLKVVQPGRNLVHARAMGGVSPPTTRMSALSIQKSRASNATWLHDSAADRPSGASLQHTWHGSPHPSGSAEQRQTLRPQQIAANTMKQAVKTLHSLLIWLCPFRGIPCLSDLVSITLRFKAICPKTTA